MNIYVFIWTHQLRDQVHLLGLVVDLEERDDVLFMYVYLRIYIHTVYNT